MLESAFLQLLKDDVFSLTSEVTNNISFGPVVPFLLAKFNSFICPFIQQVFIEGLLENT